MQESKGDAMYAFLVRRLVRRRFEELSKGEAGRVVARFGPRSVFTMVGDHALGGECRGRAAVSEWFARFFRAFPGIAIEPRVVAVDGWPWRTTIATQFVVRAELADGHRYRNEGVQLVRMRWGRILEERIYEDTAVLQDALAGAQGRP
jgi:ketosteroid isomerase-like protein